MPNATEKKKRQPKRARTEKEQAFMDLVHFWREHPYAEAWADLCKAATEFKREKTGNETAVL